MRYTAAQAQAHPWIAGTAASTDSIEGVAEEMKKFNLKRKFKVCDMIPNLLGERLMLNALQKAILATLAVHKFAATAS